MTKPFRTPGTLVISLDFELYWGLIGARSLAEYDDNLRGVHTVIPKILDLFVAKNIHATWAVVGLLITRDHTALPQTLPAYPVRELSPYYFMNQQQKVLREQPELFFAPELVTRIQQTPGQELASHTFAHYYCHHSQNVSESFPDDCTAMRELANTLGATLRTLVFPRNQVTKKALGLAATAGIKNYRGTETSFLYKNGTEAPLHLRAVRLLDNYFNLTGHHTHSISRNEKPINVPSSRFLRPYSRLLSPFESLRLKRITAAMTDAAVRGRVFHLWWHPHNFGVNQQKNVAFLRQILEHYEKLHKEYGMESCTMDEIGARRASELTV